MTVATTTNRNDYTLNGATLVYPYTFRILDAADVQVIRRAVATGVETILSYPLDYAVSGVGNTSGGAVTLGNAGTSGDLLTIRRNRPLKQTIDLKNQGRNSPADVETGLDALLMIAQQLQDQVDRSLKLGATINPAAYNLNLPDPTAGLVLTGTGTGFTMSAVGSSSAVTLPGQSRTVNTLSAYLVNNAVFNVLDYAPLGVVISTGVNDATTTLQNAMTVAGAQATGGDVLAPPGTYKQTAALLIPSNVRLRGIAGQTIFQVTVANGYALSATSKTNIAVEGIAIQGLCAIGVVFSACTKVAVRRCSFTGCTSPATGTLYAGGVQVYGCDDVFIEDNLFSGNGYIGAGLSSDIQVNGNGTVADGSKRIKITGNKCQSVAVQTNIGCYDMAQSDISDNVCSGAKTGAGNNNGYGIMIYRTAGATSIAARENRVANNLVTAVGGTGIYLQSCVRGAVVGNTVQDWGAVQDDTTLTVGAVAIQNCTDCTVVGNTASGGAKSGIVLGGIPCEGHTISGNSINTVTGSGISLRAPLVRCTITGNTIKSPSTYGIGTLPVISPHSVADAVTIAASPTVTSATAGFVKNDEGTIMSGGTIPVGAYILSVTNATTVVLSQNAGGSASGVSVAWGGITDCMITGNVIQASGLRGIDISGAYRCTLTGNTITNSGGSGLCLNSGSSNSVVGNVVYNGGTILTNTYTAIDLSACEGCLISGNNVGNDVAVGYAIGIAVPASCVKSMVTNNRAEGLLTQAYNVDSSAAAAILFAGNYNTGSALPRSFPIRQELVLEGAASSVVQIRFGDSGSYGSVGTLWGEGSVYAATNATQSTTADLWHQSFAATSKLRIARVNGDIEFYHAVNGKVDGTFAAFWGTPTHVFTNTGIIKVGSATLLTSLVALTNGAAAAAGTLTNAPVAGNPTKWVPIIDNGTTRYIPCW
jgi:parallel beta-helix repeat protein